MRGQFDMGKNKKWKSQFIVVALGQAISMLGSQGWRELRDIYFSMIAEKPRKIKVFQR